MTTQPTHLLVGATRIAALDVQQVGDLYSGRICLDAMPTHLLQLFQQFEELVESQVFNLADEIEDQIASLPLTVLYANGTEATVVDLQVYPSTKRVSFKVRQPVHAER